MQFHLETITFLFRISLRRENQCGEAQADNSETDFPPNPSAEWPRGINKQSTDAEKDKRDAQTQPNRQTHPHNCSFYMRLKIRAAFCPPRLYTLEALTFTVALR